MSFSDISGQEPAIKILKRIIANKRIASAYLFIGPEGVGKKMAAISFAEELNSEKKKIGASCPDLIVLEPKGPIQRHHIDTIREMQDFVNLRSFYGGWKVVIMDEAEKMTEEAAASLLKILEEPPSYTFFILVSSRPENIFKTILSRCQPVRFLPLKHPLTPEREAWRKEFLDGKFLDKDIFLLSRRIVDEKDREHKQIFIMETLHLLFTWWRDILFIKQGLMEIINGDYEEELTREAGKMPLASIWHSLQAIVQAQRDICHQVNSLIVLDTLFLELKTQSEKCKTIA